MFQIVKDFFQTSWSHTIAFKGGTLAYFVYNLDRFSTDIDIDCLQGLPTPQQINDIENIINTYATIKEFQKFQHMYRYIVSYGSGEHNIKIELNTRIWHANQYEVINFFGMPIQAMEKSTIFANKLVAVMDRSKPTSRDIRDVLFFFRNHFPINDAVIIERTGKQPKDFLVSLKEYINNHFVSKYIIDANLGLVLSDEQKRRAKNHLLQEVLQYIDLLVFSLHKTS